jgi:hypothetical protein
MVMATKKTVKTVAPAKAKKAVPAAKTAVVKKTTASKKEVDLEAIRKKAEEIYHARVARGEHGNAESDWHHAEKLLKTGGKPVRKPVAKKK